MALASASRFACLHIEDDESEFTTVAKKNIGKGPAKKGPQQSNNSNSKQQGQNSANTSTGAAKKKRPKKKTVKSQDGENSAQGSLKENDENKDYESELKEALLLSQLQYQEDTSKVHEDKTMLEAALRASTMLDDIVGSGFEEVPSTKRKKVKSETLTLDEYQRRMEDSSKSKSPPKSSGAKTDKSFFVLLQEAQAEAKRIAMAELKEADYKKLKPLESAIVQLYESKLEEAGKTIDSLSEENAALKDERDKTKDRVKNLCKMLQQSELKDKAELVQECEKATKVRDELLLQVSDLHGELEQSKTRIHELENELKKQQEKKAAV